MICDKDPTFRRSFLNPFLGTNDRATTATFQDILEVGKESVCNCRLFAEVLRMDALRFFPQMHLDRITCLFRIECFVLTLSLSYCIAEPTIISLECGIVGNLLRAIIRLADVASSQFPNFPFAFFISVFNLFTTTKRESIEGPILFICFKDQSTCYRSSK